MSKINFQNWFNKPFPLITSPVLKIIISIVFGFFVFMFLNFFQPFGISEVIGNKFFYTLGFGFITTFTMLLNYLILPFLFKRFFDCDRWTVGKEIFFVFWNITLITLGNWFYNSIVGSGFIKQHNFFQFLLITMSVGIFSVILLVLLTERRLYKTNSEASEKYSQQILSYAQTSKDNTRIKISQKKDNLEIGLDQLLCISSKGNYSNVYFLEEDILKTKMFRISLSMLEKQLAGFENILRCHRSHIVNAQNINNISGNARSYCIHINKLDFHIPVSRNFPKQVLDSFKAS